MKSGHAVFAPSSTATWIECSWSALNAVPEPPKPEKTRLAAEEGTRVHALLERAITAGEEPGHNDHARDTIALGMDFIRQLEPGNLHAELQVHLTTDCWGTTDLFNDAPRIVTILDLKNGIWDVDAYHNKQMLTYGAALLEKTDAEWFRFVIFQPNGLDEEPFKQWVAHRSEVIAHRDRVLRAIADRSAPKPGPHCRWCKSFQTCPAMSTDAGFVMGAMSRRMEDLTTEELVRLVRLIRALDDARSAYVDLLTSRLKMGHVVPGASLKPSRAFRSWNDATQAAKVLYENFGEKGVKPVSPAQAEKLGLAGKQYASVGSHKPSGDLKAVY